MYRMAKKGQQLTVKQLAFVRAYAINGGNATQAALTAGYSKKTACYIGHQQLQKTLIIAEITKSAAKIAAKHDITLGEIIQTARAVRDRSLQAEAVTDADGNPTGDYKYDSRGVLGANDQLAKISGAYAPEKQQVVVSFDDALLSLDLEAELRQSLPKKGERHR